MPIKNSVSEIERLEKELEIKQADIIFLNEQRLKTETEVEDLKKQVTELKKIK